MTATIDGTSMHDDHATTETAHDEPVSRRGWGKGMLLGATALGVLFASSNPESAEAAPLSDTWKLGGNAGVNTDGTNFIGPTNRAPLIFKTEGVERMRILANGNIGIGTTNPTARLMVATATGHAVFAQHTATSGAEAAVRGDTNSTAASAYGVLGIVQSSTPGTDAAGVTGVNRGSNGKGSGVRGSYVGAGYGVHGTSTIGTGVVGETPSTATGATGLLGRLTSTTPGPDSAAVHGDNKGTNSQGSGVRGTHASGGNGVHGVADVDGLGVRGDGGHTGVWGVGTYYGAVGYGNGTTGIGVFASGKTTGLYATGDTGAGVFGKSAKSHGVSGTTEVSTASGVFGSGGEYAVQGTNGSIAGVSGVGGLNGVVGVGKNNGVFGSTTNGLGCGIVGTASSGGLAGKFLGNVTVTGNISKGGGSFKIDHPLDPANKYLYHSFVESPDMKNIYDGVVTLDAKGEAVVTLPAWFDALNRDFRYQLTPIGAPGPNLYIAAKIKGTQFKIGGGTAGMEVSWQVTGIRQDAFANANRIPVEENKPTHDRGRFLHPEAFGKPSSMGVAAIISPQTLHDAPPQHHGEPDDVKS